MFKRPVLKAVLTGLIAAMLAATSLAGGPIFWEVSKQDDVVKGDARGVSIDEDGAITLAPTFDLVYDTKEAYIWSSAIDAAGNIYLGTGHEGRIFKVSPSGEGKLLYDSPELDVTAITTDPQGNVYAGTSPDGKVYKITPDGKESVLYDPPDKYIWSLLFDPNTTTLYVGTGNKGIIYKVDSAGKAAKLVDTSETNIVSLGLAKNGDLIAGTDPSGLVLRVSPAGKLFALYDSPLQEIHNLAIAPDGSIYALGINQQAGAQQRRSSVGVSSSTSVSSEGVITISSSDDQESTSAPTSGSTTDLSTILSQGKGQARSAEGAKSAVIHIMPDGTSDLMWSSRDVVGFGLKLLGQGRVLVGTGSKGRIYSISPNHNATLLIQSPEDQTSTIIGAGSDLFATSSNLGKLYRIGKQTVTEGTYTSTVRDAKFVADWGTATWRGTGDIRLETRTGNTESPDSTWSDWSPTLTKAGQQISSPKARFIQWRALIKSASGPSSHVGADTKKARGESRMAERTGQTAALESVTLAYLPRNQSPEISSAVVLPAGVALQEMPVTIDPSVASSGLDPALFGVSMNVPPRRYYQKGARSLVWQASDPNDDTLVFKVLYRSLGDTEWHLLADNVTTSYYTVDGNRLPDGSYIFKVQASDSPSNPANLALSAELVTEVVEVDNTPPAINTGKPVISGRTADVTFDATDTTSKILRAEYSIDGGPWSLVFPVDGIADSPHETFKVTATFDKPGEHVIAFRCSDASSNVGTSKVTLSMP
jgi:sugar lactone lactonase YvrE